MSKKLNKKNILIVAALAVVMLVGGISAYFTATDSATNVWTVGKVDIDLQEPEYDKETAAGETTDITPNMVVAKDPKIKNIGINDAFVFQMVSIPTATVIEAQQDGTKKAEAEIELFAYQWNEGWEVVQKLENKVIDEDATAAGPAYKDSDAYNTYIVAYAKSGVCTPLAKDATTTPLFKNIVLESADNNHSGEAGYITFKNVIENEGLEEATLKIPVKAYGIQTTDLTGDDVTGMSDVWNVLYKQTPVTENK